MRLLISSKWHSHLTISLRCLNNLTKLIVKNINKYLLDRNTKFNMSSLFRLKIMCIVENVVVVHYIEIWIKIFKLWFFKKKLNKNLLLSFAVSLCHLLYHSLSFVVICCTVRCHSLLLATRCTTPTLLSFYQQSARIPSGVP